MDEAKKNGDGLEQLAREAAEGAQFEFNPSAWSAMEQKLDAPKKGFFWWRLGGGLGLLAVIILLIVLWPSRTNQSDNASKAAIEEKVLPKKNEGAQKITDANGKKDLSSTTDESPVANPNTPNSKEVEQGANDNSKDSALNRPVTSRNQALDLKATSKQDEELSNALSETKNNTETISAAQRIGPDRVSETSSRTSTVSYFDPSQPIGTTDSIGSQMASLDEIGVETLALRWVPRVFLFDQSIKPMTLDSSYYRAADLDSLQTFKRWSFGALVSLDLSATGLDGFTNPGTMLGLLAEYRISKKWSIQSGVNYSVKNYSALGGEYDTSTWPRGRSDNLMSAIARCLVLDIPINLRRYFQGKNGNQWFVSSGVSTYLMLSEDYNYEYAIQNPNWSPTGQIRGENNHFFGIANFSVGYETPISKKLGLAFEPFMKLPLTGIGQGKVKFLSFGANVAIKLR